jgi:hypothetical protein
MSSLAQVFADVLPPDALETMQSLAAEVRSALEVPPGGFCLVASQWLPADAEPRGRAERVIREHLLPRLESRHRAAGVEWWWLVFDPGFSATGHMHFDNNLYSPAGYRLSADPDAAFATPDEVGVFYAADGGAATAVSDVRAHDRWSALTALMQQGGRAPVVSVRPRANQLLVFDGACLHGTSKSAPEDAVPRTTFVLNTWRQKPARPWWWG